MPQAQTGALADPPAATTGSAVVLLVDDERGVRTVVGEMLRSHGYTVLEARGAEDALRAAAAHPGPVHLLLTDCALWGGSGQALAAVLTDRHPGLKVLFMSGLTHPAVAPVGRDTPAHFLAKPFSGSELASKVRQVLDAA